MDLSPTRKVVLTGAAALGIVLGAAGVTAAATDTSPSTPAPSSASTTVDKPEANDQPDAGVQTTPPSVSSSTQG